jgi:hypothetical protein
MSNLIQKLTNTSLQEIPEGYRTVEKIHKEDAPNMSVSNVRHLLRKGWEEGILDRIKIHHDGASRWFYGEKKEVKAKKQSK